MKEIKRIALVLGISLYSICRLSAQPNPPPTSEGAPIDGGIVLLLVGAAAYGYRKINKHQPGNCKM